MIEGNNDGNADGNGESFVEEDDDGFAVGLLDGFDDCYIDVITWIVSVRSSNGPEVGWTICKGLWVRPETGGAVVFCTQTTVVHDPI